MSYNLIYRERYGSDGKDVVYVTYPEDDSLVRLKGNVVESLHKSTLGRAKVFFREVFLPQGYPESVSEDYWDYQLWDSIQAFCSTLSGTLTTQAILKSVGVGDSSTTSLSAAITWIMKDGTGMIGRIIFAWKEGTNLDADCKKWRLFADFLNDSAMCIEMFVLPSAPIFLTGLLCVSTTMKAIVGVAGGATKASVTQHQAIRNNLGDVSAKDGSQETCLNLIGSIFGIFLLSFIAGSDVLAKFIFLICTLLHLYSNYRAVKALNFKTLNKERLLILLKTYFKYQIVENSVSVNDKESVVLGSGVTDESFCGFHIEMGCSLKKLIDKKLINHEELNFYLQRSESLGDSYIVIVCMPLKTIFVPFKPNFNEKDVLLAYFHSVLLGIATCVTNGINLEVFSEVHKPGTPLDLVMEKFKKNSIADFRNKSKEFNLNTTLAENFMKNHNIPFEEILILDEFVKVEFESFLSALKSSGWIVDRHHVLIGDWRGLWGPDAHLKNA